MIHANEGVMVSTSSHPDGAPRASSQHISDNQILGLESNGGDGPSPSLDAERADEADQAGSDSRAASQAKKANKREGRATPPEIPTALRAALTSNPELRTAWEDAQAYRESFRTPEDARQATALLADLNRIDGLFFSNRPEDHMELAREVARLDPAAFASLAQTMAELAAKSNASEGPKEGEARGVKGSTDDRGVLQSDDPSFTKRIADGEARQAFFQSVNAAAVEGVVEAIKGQLERILPKQISKNSRQRLVGEIYREVDAALRSNRQLAAQMRAAFDSGGLDAEHQQAVVSLLVNRARQVLPAATKRVLGEWTSSVVSSNQEQRSRQRMAERRVDITGTGAAGQHRPTLNPRDLDYSKMSDADILNL